MSPNNVSPKVHENPNENLSIPSWIQADYFTEILKKDYPDLKKITKFTPIAATGPGENYVSVMVRVYIEVELKDATTRDVSYILKTTLEKSDLTRFLDNMNLFPKEKEMYSKILPQFEKLYAEAGKLVSFGPRSKSIRETSESITLIMEDLKQRNFKNIDRRYGFDFTHIEKVLQKLAEFHAASAVYYERFGPYPESFNQSFFIGNEELLRKLTENKYSMLQESLKKYGDCEKYCDLVPKPDQIISWLKKKEEQNPHEFNVLNHGDCWSNNIMFQYDEAGNINETYFVDFQICKWGSPAQDLYYMITNSSSYDIRVKQFDKFLRIYQENLAKNLKLLKYSKPIPSLRDIHITMINNLMWSYHSATSFLLVFLLDPSDEANAANFMHNEEFRRASMMNPRYVKAMKQLLPWWEDRGFFQFDE